MEAKRQALHQAGIQVDVQIVMGKSPAEAILTAVAELGADTIVMSTHGRSVNGLKISASSALSAVNPTA